MKNIQQTIKMKVLTSNECNAIKGGQCCVSIDDLSISNSGKGKTVNAEKTLNQSN